MKQRQNDLKGINQLSKESVVGVVDLVESMHQRILTLGGLLSQGEPSRTRGITGYIYQTIRKVTALSSQMSDQALSIASPLLPDIINKQQRLQYVSILNGLIGNHLQQSNNPLALDMSWFVDKQQVTPEQVAKICLQNQVKPLFLIHGLCMNDLLWCRHSHDHGQELQKSMGSIPVYVRYNSGLPIHQNGHQLAAMFRQFNSAMPSDFDFDVLCHSMGGLVMRSALHSGDLSTQSWINQINKLVFLGTPHQGAALEKAGNLIDYLITISPYSAPFAKLGQLRSQGIKDLRHGSITAEHQAIQITKNIVSYAIAASFKGGSDGLVSLNSALGKHAKESQSIVILEQNQITIHGINHMDLLSSPLVFKHLNSILSKPHH